MNIYDEAMIKLNHGMEFGMSYEQRDDILKALERGKRVEELLGLYRNLAMETAVVERSKYWVVIDKLEEEL